MLRIIILVTQEPKQWSAIMEFIGQEISDGSKEGKIADYPEDKEIGFWIADEFGTKN